MRHRWREFWLVDPLDGTKEFISRNGEFTVNVALVRDHGPVLGVVSAPVLGGAITGWQAAAPSRARRAGTGANRSRSRRPGTLVSSAVARIAAIRCDDALVRFGLHVRPWAAR